MQLFLDNGKYIIVEEGVDCSIPLRASNSNPTAWYVDAPTIEPVRANGWVGAVSEGGSVNFRNISFNPHGHGTHTECAGHITQDVLSINERLPKHFLCAQLISIEPIDRMNRDDLMDKVITLEQLQEITFAEGVEALLIRTLPNGDEKLSMHYSDTNPAYLEASIAPFLIEKGIQHLLIDLPSVDREKDGGELAFHHAYWEVAGNQANNNTITEMIFVPEQCADGPYFLNLQTAPFENDATPSRPVIFPLHDNHEEQ